MRGYYINPAVTKDPATRLALALVAYQERTGQPGTLAHVPPGEGDVRMPGVHVVEAPRTFPLRAGCYRVGQEGDAL